MRRTSRAARLGVGVGAAVLVAGVVSPSASADPDPTIAEVGDRVSQLHEAEQAIERFNTITEQVASARADLSAVRADVRSQRGDTRQLQRQVERLVLAQVDATGVVNTTAQLLAAEDPDDFLIAVVALQSYSDQSAQAHRLRGRPRPARRAPAAGGRPGRGHRGGRAARRR